MHSAPLRTLVSASLFKLANTAKAWDFTVPSVVLTPFFTDEEASWLRNTELYQRTSYLRHLGLKRYSL